MSRDFSGIWLSNPPTYLVLGSSVTVDVSYGD